MTENINQNSCLTSDVPTVGRKYLGLSRNGSYAAAARGDIPTIRVGRKLRVSIKAMDRLLDGLAERGSIATGGAK